MRCRPMGMPATLLAVLVSVGAASREGVTYRRWHNVEGDQVSEIYTDPDYQADSPDHEEVLTAFFETPVNICELCASELVGWFKAPTAGFYTFYLAADDGAELYLGPTEEDAQRIATVPGWSESREWDKYPQQTSEPQHLDAHNFYYIRAIVNEAYGGDNLAIAVTLPDGTDLMPLPIAGYVSVQPMSYAWVDIVALGAVPDGVTDSSAAFLNASAQTRWGGNIVVPSGRYRTSAFNLSSNTRLVIYGDIHGLRSRPNDQALIGWPSNAQNISIVGNGSVSSRGNGWTTNRVGFVCPHFVQYNPTPAEPTMGSAGGEGMYVLGEQGGLLCTSNRVNVGREDCLAAAMSLVPMGTSMGRTELQEGSGRNSWSFVPHGCSVQSLGDWAAHFNSGAAGTPNANNGSYTPVCQRFAPEDDAVECAPSEKQRAALFAPLDFQAQPASEREWRPSRGVLRSTTWGLP